MRKKKNEPIVEYICSNETKDFLSRLNKGEIDSERRTAFKESRYKYLKSMNAVVVIDDDSQSGIVSDTVVNWQRELTAGKPINVDYLMYVLVPEVTINAISRVKMW